MFRWIKIWWLTKPLQDVPGSFFSTRFWLTWRCAWDHCLTRKSNKPKFPTLYLSIEGIMFLFKMACYFGASMMPGTRSRWSVPAAEKHPHINDPPQCSTVILLDICLAFFKLDMKFLFGFTSPQNCQTNQNLSTFDVPWGQEWNPAMKSFFIQFTSYTTHWNTCNSLHSVILIKTPSVM